MTHVMDPPSQAEEWAREQAYQRRYNRHIDITFKCKVCGKVWAQPVIEGNTISCPHCEDECEHGCDTETCELCRDQRYQAAALGACG